MEDPMAIDKKLIFTRFMLATQLEYRLQLPMRLGLVAFGGLGGVIPGNSQFLESSKFLPGGGGGMRFELSKKYHVNLRADIAQSGSLRNSRTRRSRRCRSKNRSLAISVCRVGLVWRNGPACRCGTSSTS